MHYTKESGRAEAERRLKNFGRSDDPEDDVSFGAEFARVLDCYCSIPELAGPAVSDFLERLPDLDDPEGPFVGLELIGQIHDRLSDLLAQRQYIQEAAGQWDSGSFGPSSEAHQKDDPTPSEMDEVYLPLDRDMKIPDCRNLTPADSLRYSTRFLIARTIQHALGCRLPLPKKNPRAFRIPLLAGIIQPIMNALRNRRSWQHSKKTVDYHQIQDLELPAGSRLKPLAERKLIDQRMVMKLIDEIDSMSRVVPDAMKLSTDERDGDDGQETL